VSVQARLKVALGTAPGAGERKWLQHVQHGRLYRAMFQEICASIDVALWACDVTVCDETHATGSRLCLIGLNFPQHLITFVTSLACLFAKAVKSKMEWILLFSFRIILAASNPILSIPSKYYFH
jgi:hypothetical protein